MSTQQGMRYPLMGYVTEGGQCLAIDTCPVCARDYMYYDLVEFAFDAENAYGEPHDPELVLDCICDRCEAQVVALVGQDVVQQLLMDGELDEMNDLARLAREAVITVAGVA